MSARRIPHLPALDGLRAIAVVAVVAFHAGLLRGGWLGVEIFFVLSGFLITSILAAEFHETDSVDLSMFWLRRLRRLLPALALLLGLVVILSVFDQIVIRGRGVLGAVTYSTNWLQIVGKIGYWDQFADRDPLEHLWSLAIEEQVYLVWPVLVFCVSWYGGLRLVKYVAGGLAIAAAGVGFLGVELGWSVNRLYLGTDVRCAGFLIGATASLIVRQWNDQGRDLRRVTAHPLWIGISGGIVLVALLGLRGDSDRIFRGPLLVVALASACFVASCATREFPSLVAAPMQAVGRWSYGIYVFHYPLMQSRALADLPDVARLAIVLAASTALAALSYQFVEQPVRLRRASKEAVALLAVGGFACAGFAGFALAQPAAPALTTSAPLPSRDPSTDPPPPPTLADGPMWSVDIIDEDPSEPAPSEPAPSEPGPSEPGTPDVSISATSPVPTVQRVPVAEPGPLRLMIIGDSVPALAASEISTVALQRGDLVDVYAQPGCVMSFEPADQVEPKRCVDYLNSIPDRIRQSDPDIVLIWWGGTGATLFTGGQTHEQCSATGTATIRSRVEGLLQIIDAAGKRAMLATPSPRLDQGLDGPIGTRCEVVTLGALAAEAAVPLVAIGSFVCPSFPDDCARVERRDGLHYTSDGAEKVAGFVLDEVSELSSRG